MLMKFLTLFFTHLKWVLDFLIYYPFYTLLGSQLPIIGEEESICHYESNESTPASEEDVDCAVCLCKIEEGEETSKLRCDHIFHTDCLGRWVAFNNPTCPLCRETVLGPRRVITELGAEVLFFQFCSVHTDDDRETWWLR